MPETELTTLEAMAERHAREIVPTFTTDDNDAEETAERFFVNRSPLSLCDQF